MKAEIIELKNTDKLIINVYDSGLRYKGMKIFIESSGNNEVDLNYKQEFKDRW